MTALARAIVAAAVLIAAVATAAAQPAPGDDAAKKAAARFRQGQEYFKAGDFDRAVGEYEAAFALVPEPSLVFNIGLAHDKANHAEAALSAYRRYLDLAPGGDAADEARESVARLSKVVDQLHAEQAAAKAKQDELARQAEAARQDELARQAEAARETEARARASRRARTKRRAWILLGSGAALVAAGVAVDAFVLQPLRDDLGKSQFAYDRDIGSFKTARWATIGLWTGGAIALGFGAVLMRRAVASDVSIAVDLHPTGGVIVVGWTR